MKRNLVRTIWMSSIALLIAFQLLCLDSCAMLGGLKQTQPSSANTVTINDIEPPSDTQVEETTNEYGVTCEPFDDSIWYSTNVYDACDSGQYSWCRTNNDSTSYIVCDNYILYATDSIDETTNNTYTAIKVFSLDSLTLVGEIPVDSYSVNLFMVGDTPYFSDDAYDYTDDGDIIGSDSYYYKLDISTMSFSAAPSPVDLTYTPDSVIIASFPYDDGMLYILTNSYSTSDTVLFVDNDGTVHTVTLQSTYYNDFSVNYCQCAMISDNEFYIGNILADDGSSLRGYVINTDSYEMETGSIPVAITTDSKISVVDDDIYIQNEDGLYKYNDGTVTPCVDFTHAVGSYENTQMLQFVAMKDGEYIFAGNNSSRVSMSITLDYMIMGIEESQDDYSDYSVITAGYPMNDKLSENTLEAIDQFNLTNGEYLIKPVKYNADGINPEISITYPYASDNSSDISVYRAYLDSTDEYIDKLGEIILSDDAPDIVLDAGVFAQLDTSDYFVDLNDCIDGDDGIDRNEYFNNVLTACNTSDALYQMPITFDVNGLTTDSDYTGFTYDNYYPYLQETGQEDLMACTLYRYQYFEECFSVSYQDYINREQGTVSLQNDSFYALLNYMASISASASYDDQTNYYSLQVCQYSKIHGLDSYLYSCYVGNSYYETGDDGTYLNLVGIPSYVERGAAASIVTSAAITNKSDYADAAWSFIKFLASEDIQSLDFDLFSENSSIPININACTAIANLILHYYGDESYSTSVDAYLACIESVDTFYCVDTEIRCASLDIITSFLDGELTAQEAAEKLQSELSGIITQ